MEAAAYNGRGMGALAAAFDMERRYGDGANLYQYLGSSPWQRFDPMGLSWDPFDMVDEIASDRVGSSAALLQALGNHANSIAVVSAHILSYLPFPAASIAGELALAALGEQSDEAAMAAIAMGLIPGGKLLGGLGRVVGGIGSAAWGGAMHYAGKVGAKLGKVAGSLLERAKGWLHRKKALPNGSCPIRCFVAGTLVLTAAGPMPIEQLCAGDIVLSFNEHTGAVEANEVVATVSVPAAAILEVTVGHENGVVETIGTTDDHPFYVSQRAANEGGQAWMPGWVQASQLNGGDTLRTLNGSAIVLDVVFSSRRETVYNLQVANASTYFAGVGAVGVHNCDVTNKDIREFAKIWLLNGPKTHPKLGKKSHGQEWFEDSLSNKWYTFDKDSHNGGVWKVFDRQGNRLHTVDLNGQIVGK